MKDKETKREVDEERVMERERQVEKYMKSHGEKTWSEKKRQEEKERETRKERNQKRVIGIVRCPLWYPLWSLPATWSVESAIFDSGVFLCLCRPD